MNNPTTKSVEAKWHTFDSEQGSHLFVVNNSQVFDISTAMKLALDDDDPIAEETLLPVLDILPTASLQVPAPPPAQSISLNVSSSCNLACTYCYAAQGSFGGVQAKHMSWSVARTAIDRLLSTCDRNAPVTIGFLGGEPFVNRQLLHQATKYAVARGQTLGQDVRFSVTTNGTLLNAADIHLMRTYPFAVTISVDGGRKIQEMQRPGANFDELVDSVRPLLEHPGQARISARATVSRKDFNLIDRFDALLNIGFRDIGFSPVRVGAPEDALCRDEWKACLTGYRELGMREIKRLQAGEGSSFSNLVVALKQIHRGACAPYPCGAGGGYFSVAEDGTWYACHRAIGDNQFAMGDSFGLDMTKRITFLHDRHVHQQTDCRTCWARYLCSGSCHQEASVRSVESCDFIRGWLEFCLSSYSSLTPTQCNALLSGENNGREI